MNYDVIILLSGGLDSATVLGMLESRGERVLALSFDYGQRHSREIKQARLIADYYGVGHRVIAIDSSMFEGSSALTGGGELAKCRGADEIEAAGVPASYVPGRNTLFAAYALSFAEMHNAEAIAVGVCATDAAGYPDTRPEYISALSGLAKVATKGELKVYAPLLNWSKARTVAKAMTLGVPIHMTSSCYDVADGVACGECDACVLRLSAFAELGAQDPIKYRAKQ